jgi:hypothetical protein
LKGPRAYSNGAHIENVAGALEWLPTAGTLQVQLERKKEAPSRFRG